MQNFKPIDKDEPTLSALLRVIMWILFVPLVLGIYGNWLLWNLDPPMTRLVDSAFTVLAPLLVVLYLVPSFVLYAGQISFLILWCVGLLICTWLWIVSQSG